MKNIILNRSKIREIIYIKSFFLVCVGFTFLLSSIAAADLSLSDKIFIQNQNWINSVKQQWQDIMLMNQINQINNVWSYNSYIPPLAERCTTNYWEHSIPSTTEKNTCDCEPWYVFWDNNQCELSSQSIICQNLHWPLSYAGLFGFCMCKKWYMLVWDSQCILWSSKKEVCQKLYGGSSDIQYEYSSDWTIILNSGKCICNDWYTLIEEKCIETIWHKIKIFFRSIF